LPPTVLSVLEDEYLFQLRTVIAAGESCSAEIVERWAGGRRFIDAYGPTEATVCASMGVCEAGSHRNPTIGRPIANVRMYVLDEELEPAPIGVIGEIYISGAGLSRGYLGKPELTAERFIPNRFDRRCGERLYRTGDLGRYLPDGEIEFNGRKDTQVKLRGYRIELGEIEAALNEHGSVRQSAVMVSENERGDRLLVGYVVGEGGVATEELKAHVRERLPEYMVPSVFVLMEEMPRTPNGKLDRKRLLALADTAQPAERSLVSPRDVLEFKLMQVWENVLGTHPIDVRDNFFDLGGHSLLAVRLMAGIRNAVGRELPLSALFQGGTIEHLAAILRRDVSSMSWSCLVELQPSGSQPPLFLVHPGGGNVLCYFELARCLGKDRPIYGIQTPGLYRERPFYTRIEDLAAHYVEAIRTVHPEGPYLLGGWSLGGVVAFEMAQQLTAQSQMVDHLLIFDSAIMSARGDILQPDRENVDDEDTEDMEILMQTVERFLPITMEEIQHLHGDELIEFILRKAVAMNISYPDIEVAQVRHLLTVAKTNMKAMDQYVPRVYSGSVTLLKTANEVAIPPSGESMIGEQAIDVIQDPTMGWGELASGGVRIVNVPGDHTTMLSKPHVETLAQRIKAHLGDTQTIPE
jgi:thioesterase domain-containing protein